LPADVRVEPRRLSSAVPRGVLSLSPDQNIENIDIELPRLELATLSISVVRPDGHPAGRGLIEVRQADGRMMLRGFPLNETGSITLQGLVGQSYQLQAYFDDPESHRQLRSESLSIVIERENPLVTLRLRSPQ